MKWKILKISNLILAVLLAVFAVGYTFAWFADYYAVDIKLYADPETGYFYSGSGTETDPYIITNSRHLYNLSWLQNTGKFASTITYFELGDDIDMSDSGKYFVIPPIGNDKYPFTGSFDGNGYTISNLIVSTDKNKLTNFPNESASGYAFSKYVGLFGNTGSSSTITNFILDDPIVEVSSKNTTYSSSGSSSCVGLAVGYVAGNVSSIGVIGGTLAVQQTGYKTYNSILGAYDEDNITSSVTGSELGYGTSIDLENLYNTLISNTETKDTDNGTAVGVVKGDYVLPFKAESQDFISPTESKYYITNVGNVDAATTQKASTKGNNIGYYVGPDVKVYDAREDGGTTTDFYNKYYSKFYYPSSASGEKYECGVEYYGTTYPAPDSEVTDYLKQKGSYLVRLTNASQLSYNKDDLTIVEDGQVGTYTGRIIVPNNCIWVAPVESGTFKFVVVNITNANMSFRVARITRSTPRDYSTAFSVDNNYMYVNALLLPGYSYYFEIEISDDDIDAGYEYAITTGDKNSYSYQPYLAYIDIGTDGVGSGSTTTPTEKTIVDVDFIYDGVEIVDGEFVLENTTTPYVETGTMIYLSTSASTTTTAVLILAYTRSSDDSDNDGYYGSTSYTLYVAYYSADTEETDVPSQSVADMAQIVSAASSDSYFEYYYDVDAAY